MIKIFILLSMYLLWGSVCLAQRKQPRKTKEEKQAERQTEEDKSYDKLMWDPRQAHPRKHRPPVPTVWQTGSAGIIPSEQGEISLFTPSRIGFSKQTEWLVRIAEMPFLPNIGLKHRWWGNRRFVFSSEHTLLYTYPMLKILQNTGLKSLVPDTAAIPQQLAMRLDLLLSWLVNPRIDGCPGGFPEMMLTLKAGSEFNLWNPQSDIRPFDYLHAFYHTQLLDNKALYYAGLQLDSYFSHRFRYSLSGTGYSVDLTRSYAVEANVRLNFRISPHLGISAVAKGAYIHIQHVHKFTCLPLLDLTYYIHPDRRTVRTGPFKQKYR